MQRIMVGFFFFFQAEDGIRDLYVTGVQTCALPISLEKLNLHPDLKRYIAHHNGLIIVSGPTGSGKSSTMAALIQEINVAEARHIVTIERSEERRVGKECRYRL